MPTASTPYRPIPDVEVPVVDPQTGKMTPEWYRFFKQFYSVSKIVRSEIP